ncbi:MAG: type II toxin-antitoxin system HicA family toxin [Planctomycetaceae bacterium]|nr:type II toxin-antitoxin system HicA family toxin [Planctomycetaceae bacterium]
MGSLRKILQRILSGSADRSIRFDELIRLLKSLGFTERIRGDHHILTRTDLEEILNLQPRGHHAKPYQVKQVREIIVREGWAPADQQVEDADGGSAGDHD